MKFAHTGLSRHIAKRREKVTHEIRLPDDYPILREQRQFHNELCNPWDNGKDFSFWLRAVFLWCFRRGNPRCQLITISQLDTYHSLPSPCLVM